MMKYMVNSYKFLSIALFLVIWQGVAHYIDNPLLFPDVISILYSLKSIICRAEFIFIILKTLLRLLQGVIFSSLIAIFLATLSYNFAFIEIIFKPFSLFLRAVPTIAIIILVLIWASVEKVPVVVGFLILFPILYENILGSLKQTDKNLLKMAKVFKVNRWRVIYEIYIPSVYSELSLTLPAYFGLAFKVIIAGEVLTQENLSIGGEIFINKIYLESANIFSWIIIVIILNFLLEGGVRQFNKKICRWRKNES